MVFDTVLETNVVFDAVMENYIPDDIFLHILEYTTIRGLYIYILQEHLLGEYRYEIVTEQIISRIVYDCQDYINLLHLEKKQ